MGARAGRRRRAGAAPGGIPLSGVRPALLRRSFARAAAAPRAGVRAPGAGRLGPLRRRRPFRRAQPLGQLPRASHRQHRAPGRRAAARSGGDEHPVGEPASLDGVVLPPAPRQAPPADREGRLPFRPVRGSLAGPLSRLPGRGSGERRAAARPAGARRHRAGPDRQRELPHRPRVRHAFPGSRGARQGRADRIRSRAWRRKSRPLPARGRP